MIRITNFIFATAVLCLGGCTSTEIPEPAEEFVMPRMQQNTYLSHAKPAQHFGFRGIPAEDGQILQGAARLHPNQTQTIKLGKENVPVVSVRGHARRIKMNSLLDTSSPASWMEFGTSQQFEATFLGTKEDKFPYTGTYNTGNVAAFAAVISKLRIGSISIENTPLYVRMALHSLGPLARGFQVPHIDSVLGYDLLETFEYVQFDYHKRQIHFSSTLPYEPNEAQLMTSAKISAITGHGLAVEGHLMGVPTPIVLDVAGDYYFSRGDVKVSVTKQVSLGDVVYRKVPTLLLPTYEAPPRAGRKMLEKYILTICPRKGVVYFERFPE